MATTPTVLGDLNPCCLMKERMCVFVAAFSVFIFLSVKEYLDLLSSFAFFLRGGGGAKVE
jgi:hypothetical protein